MAKRLNWNINWRNLIIISVWRVADCTIKIKFLGLTRKIGMFIYNKPINVFTAGAQAFLME
jgi:hypothetical protein